MKRREFRKGTRKAPPVAAGAVDGVLDTPIRDLGLKVEGTILERCSKALVQELRQAGITRVEPDFYLGLEYGVPSHSSSVSMLFLDAVTDPKIMDAMLKYGERPCTEDEIMMCLRHEAGHLFCYAYKAYEDPYFIRLFEVKGNFLDYPHWSKPWTAEADGTKYVQYLETQNLAPEHYAQKHPDDDFAETFAVWLDRSSDWRAAYAERPAALKKIELAGVLVDRWGKQPPIVSGTNDSFAIRHSDMTLRKYLEWE